MSQTATALKSVGQESSLTHQFKLMCRDAENVTEIFVYSQWNIGRSRVNFDDPETLPNLLQDQNPIILGDEGLQDTFSATIIRKVIQHNPENLTNEEWRLRTRIFAGAYRRGIDPFNDHLGICVLE